MPQAPGLLTELPGFVGPAGVLAYLLQLFRNVGPVPDARDPVAAAQQFLGPAEVRRLAAPRQVAVGPANPTPPQPGSASSHERNNPSDDADITAVGLDLVLVHV